MGTMSVSFFTGGDCRNSCCQRRASPLTNRNLGSTAMISGRLQLITYDSFDAFRGGLVVIEMRVPSSLPRRSILLTKHQLDVLLRHTACGRFLERPHPNEPLPS